MPSFRTPEPIHLLIDLPHGDIEVSSAHTDVTEVHLRPSNDDHHIVIEQQPGVVAVAAPRGFRSWFSDRGHASVRAVVPAGSHLTVDLGSGDISARGDYADGNLRTGGGDIHIDRVQNIKIDNAGGDSRIRDAVGDVDVTGAGDIRIDQAAGNGRVSNGAGDTYIGHILGDLTLVSSAGDTSIDRVGGVLSAKAACGDLRVQRVEGAHVRLISAHGDIEVGVPTGMSVWLDADTGYGDLRNELADLDGPRDGADTLELVAKSGYGDIRVRRA